MAEDTISAVITALGQGAVGIVRISGPDALAVSGKLFRAASGKNLADYSSHTMVYGHIYDLQDNSLVDEVLAVYMAAPHSYTAEDVVEIQCHGSIQALRKILSLTYAAGAKPAERGEFTKRAFLNGRIDLTQAEAVMDIISSRSEASLKLAARQQNGELAGVLHNLRRQLLDIVVCLEAVIDYPEEDIEEITFGEVKKKILEVGANISDLLNNAHTGRILREGLRTAIIGRPNVGKSSLLNALLKEERAIVSEYAGTTRDVIEEQLLIDGVPLVLSDTAGIRKSGDYVEQLGVKKTRELLKDTELVICVVDGNEDLIAEDEEIFQTAATRPYVIIVNKSDLNVAATFDILKQRFGSNKVIALSAKTGVGMDELFDWLKSYVYGDKGTLSSGIYVQNARHEELLRQALQSLTDAGQAASDGMPYDCIIIDVRRAINLLGEITGDTIPDEIINEIFSRFCIGK